MKIDKDVELKYTKYINEHCKYVKEAFNWLVSKRIITKRDKLKCAPLIKTHDGSKFLDEEFALYAEHFYGDHRNMDTAWLHHIHNNPHHWNYWVIVDSDGVKALPMPREYVIEMLCDWMSFSFKANNLSEVLDWYEKNKDKMILHPKTRELVEFLLNKYKERSIRLIWKLS